MSKPTINEMRRMLIELTTGAEPSLRNPEADALREQFKREIAEIKAKGGSVDIPPEIA